MFLVFVNLLPKKNSNKQCDTDNLVGIAISTFAVMNLPLSDLVETEYNWLQISFKINYSLQVFCNGNTNVTVTSGGPLKFHVIHIQWNLYVEDYSE